MENTTKKNVNIYSTVDSPNICLNIDKDEKYAFAGILIFHYNKLHRFNEWNSYYI
jgi:hypothetical protein